MNEVWDSFMFLSLGYKKTHSEALWKEKILDGDITIKFTLDNSVLNIDESVFTIEKFQEIYKNNNDNDFVKYSRCYKVNYDSSTGVGSASFKLYEDETSNIEGVRAYKIYDNANARPSKLSFGSPDGVVTLLQKNFEKDKIFSIKNVAITGTINLRAMYVDALPIIINGTAKDINTQMQSDYSQVIVSYVDESNKKIFKDTIITGKIGNSYETSAVNIKGYILKNEPSNKNGFFSDETQRVIYVYKKTKKDSNEPKTPIAPHEKDPNLPKTGADISLVFILLSISTVTALTGAYLFKKQI